MSTTPFGPCKGQRKDGQKCGGWAISDRGYCVSHDPQSAGVLAAARRAGGRARHGRKIGATGNTAAVTLQTLGDVLALLQRAVNDVLALESSIARARALGYLAGAWGTLYESSELEKRVAALEAQHGQNT